MKVAGNNLPLTYNVEGQRSHARRNLRKLKQETTIGKQDQWQMQLNCSTGELQKNWNGLMTLGYPLNFNIFGQFGRLEPSLTA